MKDGASVNVSAIRLSPHVGTHADTPLHVRDGAPGSEAFDLPAFLGAALVVSVDDLGSLIAAAALMSRLPDGEVERLLLRTGHSIASGAFPAQWPVLDVDLVSALADRGLRLLGVDAPSVDDRESKTLDVHHALFRREITIIENLDLRHVADGAYDLIALPLRLEGLDAAPVRAVLRPR